MQRICLAPVVLALVVAPLAACGSDDSGDDDQPSCEPPQGELPTDGAFADPMALPLANCVEGGLVDLPGRWFVHAPDRVFTFDYPKFEGTCETGFHRAFFREEDHDINDDGRTFFSWSDGTRYYHRTFARFQTDSGTFEFASAFAACMQPDGTLAAVTGRFDTDRGEAIFPEVGTRFGLKDAPAEGIELVGEFGMAPDHDVIGYNVVVDAGTAYVVGQNGLDIISVANPAAPVHVASVPGAFNDVRIVRSATKVVAYVSPIEQENTKFIDVTNPAAPVVLGELPEYSHSLQIAIEGPKTMLYLATYTDQIPKYDVTDPTNPMRLGAAVVPGEQAGIHDLTVDGTRIYANNTTAGVVAIDTAAGLTSAVEVGRLQTSYSHAGWVGAAGGRAVYLHGDEGMTGTPDGGAFMRVFDGDPSSPTYMTVIGKYQSRPEVGIHNFELHDNLAYIAYYQDGVRIVDMSDPTQPREVAHFNTWDPETAPGGAFEGALGIRLVDGLIYVAELERGLLILRKL
ncbi:MAG TPA: hypothetical protein VFQ53_06670 [Kofleriaceae bacterium]|nr:hypothetical protein [Kofleriaceae bacterium]